MKAAHGAKKKKKKSKKKKNKSGVTSGDALGLDDEDESKNQTGFQTIKESEIDEEENFEEEKMPGNMSRTRVIDQTDNMGSLDQAGSNFDMGSIEMGDQSYTDIK